MSQNRSEQQAAAQQEMIEWLSNEQELGKAPAKLELVKEIDYLGMHYYVYKYKKHALGQWLLGVCGGYEADHLEHCGHVFSEMEPYEAASAEQDAIALIEQIRQYYMNLAEESEAEDDLTGNFTGFVLLDSCMVDLVQIQQQLRTDWGIVNEVEKEDDAEENDEVFVYEIDGMMVAVSYMPFPVPEGEAEECAAYNYLWPEAVEVTKRHKAQILLAVLGREQAPVAAGVLYTKVAASCLKVENALGIYTSGTVYPPDFFLDVAALISEGELPLLDLVYFGLYQDEVGMNAYTYGLRNLGKQEMEIVGSQQSAENLRNFLYDIAYYVVEGDIILQDGETLGRTAEEKLPIVLSEGINVGGQTLKITF